MKRATIFSMKLDTPLIISIHALVKRATTPSAAKSVYPVDISIHALVKRATYGAGKVSVGLGDFNPRPREEGDHG